MRSVSSATWTSVLPVSEALSPKRSTSSCLRAFVSAIRGRRLAGRLGAGSGAELARVLDVLGHLLDQGRDAVEAPLAPKADQELDRQKLSVEVDVAVDQVGLDEHRPPGPESRPHADVDRRADAPGAGRVDTVARADESFVGDDVGRRVAQLAAAAVARNNGAAQAKGGAEEAAGHIDLAGEDEPPDMARGDHLAVDLDQVDDASLEAAVRGQEVRVAAGAVAEAEVLADRDVGGAQLANEDVVDEGLGALMREALIERDHDELLHTQGLDQLGLGVEARQELGRGLGAHDAQRVRLEGQDGVVSADHLAVAEVHAVELADRDPARTRVGV